MLLPMINIETVELHSLMLDACITVSYTHLDVYKRQPLRR